MKIDWLTEDAMAIREVEHLLKNAKIKYKQVRIDDSKWIIIDVSTYKRAKDTIKLLMDKTVVDRLGFRILNNRYYTIHVKFEALKITQ